MIRALVVALVLAPAPAFAIDICQGSNRAERRATCIVDGDGGWEAGIKWRLRAIDAPEISKPECPAEKRIGLQARDRLAALMSEGYRIIPTGKPDRYNRQLVDIELADGQDAGRRLIDEGLAQPWPNKGNRWCGR